MRSHPLLGMMFLFSIPIIAQNRPNPQTLQDILKNQSIQITTPQEVVLNGPYHKLVLNKDYYCIAVPDTQYLKTNFPEGVFLVNKPDSTLRTLEAFNTKKRFINYNTRGVLEETAVDILNALQKVQAKKITRKNMYIDGVVKSYPNPTNGTFNITYTAKFNGPVRIGIFDSIGRRIDEYELGTMDVGQQKEVHVPFKFASGSYIIRSVQDTPQGERIGSSKVSLVN